MNETPIERQDQSAWTKLRRRKVVQWGLAYAAGAWGLLQGLSYVTATFHWPEQIQQLTTLALLIGLPIVLVLAWYHGDRGQRRITTSEFAILTLLLVLGGGVFWYYEPTSEAGKNDAAKTADLAQRDASPGTRDARPSVAVLPFENRSRLEDDAFFVDGMHDDILTQLSKVSALRVISRTSVARFRKTDLSVQQIAQQLGVRSILEGGVQRAGDRVRINVQLIDAATDAHHWAESYDRELTAANIFAIQSELAQAIAGALKTALTPAEQTRTQVVPTHNLDAWEAYQLGKQRMINRNSANLADAERFFREAIGFDPEFALAYVGLADALDLQVVYSGLPPEPTYRDAEAAVAEALKLDPNLAEAWASAGGIATDRFQLDRAETMFRRAIELNPNYAPARLWYGLLLAGLGRQADALPQLQRAVELDPLSGVVQEALGFTLEGQGDFSEAEAQYRKALKVDPSRPGPYERLAFLNAYALQRTAEAVPLIETGMKLDAGSPSLRVALAGLYLDLGEDTRLAPLLTLLEERWPDDFRVQDALASAALFRADSVDAMRHAQRALNGYPQFQGPLAILRNADLRSGRHDAARVRYEKAFPNLFIKNTARVDAVNCAIAIDLALVEQKRGDTQRAGMLLDGSEHVIGPLPRLGALGYGIMDVQIHALRGQKNEALKALRVAGKAGWRGPLWRYHRDFDPNLASIRNEPEFKAVFADIERDMAQQRARLAARPKDAPLELSAITNH